ncbi:hypothetical protein GQ43DRAFT_473276 [Delitschia confertaspora ATCC 74209]|uniref:Uncharacterized protein n=1 Tax=Delitschia confertaspora ATCC 74209 TaxID=1513339 RepID=A0A9P4JIJ8_9PLEO|nr:hypothetical protein GQ43DRAFT_473276 [Delitschia confertaspora ATCC 74209]
MLKHTTTNEVILRNQSDWELWIYVIKRVAEAGDVWEYINFDQHHRPLTRPEKPTKPTVATLAASPTEADGSASTTLPIAVDFTQYKIELDEYYKELKDYRRLKYKFGQVDKTTRFFH